MTQKGKWEILLKNTESRLSEPYPEEPSENPKQRASV
uniref:Uncharacterized protein n=1 Tax=Rhizophora mucronata TaxID=61149 RepID=A0A2P2M129_RHIMU